MSNEYYEARDWIYLALRFSSGRVDTVQTSSQYFESTFSSIPDGFGNNFLSSGLFSFLEIEQRIQQPQPLQTSNECLLTVHAILIATCGLKNLR